MIGTCGEKLASFPRSGMYVYTGRAWYLSYVTWRNQSRTRIERHGEKKKTWRSSQDSNLGPLNRTTYCALFNQLYIPYLVCPPAPHRKIHEVSCWLPSLLFPVMGLQVCSCTTKVFLPPPSTFDGGHIRNNYQALLACTTSMFAFQSRGAWERG